MEVIKKGSIEPLLVALGDRLNNVLTLSSVTSLVFDTKKKSDNTAIQTDSLAVVDTDYPMTAICQIDSTLAGYDVSVDDAEFKLYIKYTVGTEAPILGPIFFRVEDD
jgi:hypothetical protein